MGLTKQPLGVMGSNPCPLGPLAPMDPEPYRLYTLGDITHGYQ